MSDAVISWLRPWIVTSPVILCAESEEPLLLTRAWTAPVMALNSTSPWSAAIVKGALSVVTETSPRLASMVRGVAEGDGDDEVSVGAVEGGQREGKNSAGGVELGLELLCLACGL